MKPDIFLSITREIDHLIATHTEDIAILGEVLSERVAQDEKWGEQNHPDGTGCDLELMAVGAPRLSDWARARCEAASEEGRVTWADILTEEWAEALDAEDEDLREELVQVAAVAVAWIGAIDRRKARS